MFLMIDNYDSFVYNLVRYFKELNQDIKVVRRDKIDFNLIDEKNIDSIYELKEINFDKINQIVMREAEKSGKWLLDALDNVMGRK